MDASTDNSLYWIIHELLKNGKITKEEAKVEREMFESYKNEGNIQGLKSFWNNEGKGLFYRIEGTNFLYNDHSKYDCCYYEILKLFNVIYEDEE